jgi:hypothetical protein
VFRVTLGVGAGNANWAFDPSLCAGGGGMGAGKYDDVSGHGRVPWSISRRRWIRVQNPGNRGDPTVAEGLSTAQEERRAICYAVATPLAEPGKTRHYSQNPGDVESDLLTE